MENTVKKIKFLLLIITVVTAYSYTQPNKTPKSTPDKPEEIVFGQSAFLSEGSLQLYGELIRNAINARFKRVNQAGGIKKKQLRLLSLDDGGKPTKTKENIELMRKQKIDMFLGNMGTRNTLEILPLIQQKKIAVFFPWGGSPEFRKPNLSHIINGLGLIEPQIEALVDHTINTIRLKKIAIFHDDGTFGIQNKNMLVDALARYKTIPTAIASYNRFTMDIKTPSQKLIKADPKIVICLATSMPTVKLINNFFEQGHYGTKFIGIDSTMFVETILQRKGVVFHYASPMPNPQTSEKRIVREFREDMKKYFPTDPLNILSLSYYLHAALIADALGKIEGPITKEKLLNQMEILQQYDLGGFSVTFDKETRHAYPHTISILKG